jgi:membrane associated rhomboid family serine protease
MRKRYVSRITSLQKRLKSYTIRNADPEYSKAVLPGIILLNGAVYAGWQMDPYYMLKHFTVSHDAIMRYGRFYTLFTSTISHKDGWHLFGNMFTLFFFGREAIALLGVRKFLTLYLTGGILSSLTHVLQPYIIPHSWPGAYSHNKRAPALGASGAVNGLIAYSILMFPTRMIYLYMVIPVPAALLGVLFIGKDMLGLYSGGGSVGNAGHLAGAAWGAVYFMALKGRGGMSRFRRF